MDNQKNPIQIWIIQKIQSKFSI